MAHSFQTEYPVTRRYDLDWLRILALATLVFYHIGMFYVLDWEWHVKSPVQSTVLQDVMILTNQWRMSLLFLVSGMVLALTLNNKSRGSQLRTRSYRLLIPLIFGMCVVVAPQVYVEGRQQGLLDIGFGEFWLHYINLNTHLLSDHHGPLALLTWNHLWYLPYLWCYSMILIAVWPWVSPSLRLCTESGFDRLIPWCGVIIALTIVYWWHLKPLYPTTHDLLNDWYRHAQYFTVFMVGALLTSLPRIWQKIMFHRRRFLFVAILCYAFIIADRHGQFPQLAAGFPDVFAVKLFYAVIVITNHWFWLFAIIGYGARYLQFYHPILPTLNRAVLPSYLVHQTATVVLGYWVVTTQVSTTLGVIAVVGGTLLACFLWTAAALKWRWFGWLNGMSESKRQPDNGI